MGLLTSLRRRSLRRRTYNELMTLDDHLLRDIGLTRGDVLELIASNRTAHTAGIRGHE
jgi:uncharacterized protein YjiS (DUF1127 family)